MCARGPAGSGVSVACKRGQEGAPRTYRQNDRFEMADVDDEAGRAARREERQKVRREERDAWDLRSGGTHASGASSEANASAVLVEQTMARRRRT